MAEPLLVIGLGNPLLSDDGVGPRVVEELRRQGVPDFVTLQTDTHGGLRLMERLIGWRRAIIVDAIVLDPAAHDAPPGTLVQLDAHDLPTVHSASSHDATLPEALAFGRRAGAELPADADIKLVGVQAAELVVFSERCTPLVEAAIGPAADLVRALFSASARPEIPASDEPHKTPSPPTNKQRVAP